MDDEGDMRHWLPPAENGKPQVVTPTRKQRGDVVAVVTDRGGREYRSLASPLEFYVARGYVSGLQYRAGCRIHALWRGSIIASRYTRMRFGDVVSDFDPECIPLIPRDYFRAMDAVSGFLERSTLRRVCCFEEPAGSGRAMQLLRAGLDDLVKHFRYFRY